MTLPFLRSSAYAAGLLWMYATPSFATSADIQASVVIHPPLQIAATEPLAFGVVAPSKTLSGTVIVNPQNDHSSSCDSNLDCMESGNRAKFVISGRSSQAVSISTTQSIFLSSAEGDDMQVNAFTIAGSGYSNGIGYISETGLLELGIGATLNVTADQAVGSYAGVFQVTVAYQ